MMPKIMDGKECLGWHSAYASFLDLKGHTTTLSLSLLELSDSGLYGQGPQAEYQIQVQG